MILGLIAAAGVGARIIGITRLYDPTRFRPDAMREVGTVVVPLGSATSLDFVTRAALMSARVEGMQSSERRGLWPRARPAPVPALGANDRSRWLTVRCLVDQDTYAVGYRATDPATGRFTDYGPITELGWNTNDCVLDPEPHHCVQSFYSSKPPFLATLVAGEYWICKRTLGLSITQQPGAVFRIILLTINEVPWIAYLFIMARMVERCGRTDWGKLFVFACAGFGTFLSSFSMSLNNHTVAAWSCLFALYAADRICAGGKRNARYFLLAGLWAGLAACTELPAVCYAVMLSVLVAARAPARTCAFFLPALLVPVAGFLVTNYLAIGRVTPPYGEVGGPWYEYKGSYWERGEKSRGIDWASRSESRPAYGFHLLLGHHGFFSLTPIFLIGLAGIIASLSRRNTALTGPAGGRLAPALTGVCSAIVFAFYIFIAPARNYGGWTHGPRWLIWLTPLWLLSMGPAADWMSERRLWRCLGYPALVVSIFSVNYPFWNPWQHPWLYDLLEARGWISY
jgi:hypothetical protein